jgi:enoyl-CoA hydratase/carnithine racemase
MPETKIGFFTDVGCGSTLASLRNNIGMYIALTSGRLKGEEVYNTGFANYFVNKENIQKIYE